MKNPASYKRGANLNVCDMRTKLCSQLSTQRAVEFELIAQSRAARLACSVTSLTNRHVNRDALLTSQRHCCRFENAYILIVVAAQPRVVRPPVPQFMRLLNNRTFGTALALATALLASCSPPSELPTSAITSKKTIASVNSASPVVISQIYGGGGNAGATYTNDYIELFNRSGSTVDLTGWSVQYASAAGTSWAVTPLSGVILPGQYYLVQEAVGAGGNTALPSPNATGTIAMAAGAGKVAVSTSIAPITGTCGTTNTIIYDLVSYGTTATNCGNNTTATITNTTATARLTPCTITADLSVDFTSGAPTPHNLTNTTASPCAAVAPAGPLDHVLISGLATVSVGGIAQFTATAQDANNVTVTGATITWSSSDINTATVDATGKVTGVAANATPVTITVTAVSGNITKMATSQITVGAPSIAFIDISASATSFPAGFQAQLFPTARVSSGGTIIAATFVFEALDPTIATVANVANTGLVTSVSASATKPRFKVTATPVGGGTPYSFTTSPITVEADAPAPLSIYTVNDEFGDPTAAGTNVNDQLIVRAQYTLSYNQSRGTPNWVSYELDARQMVTGQDRCNCFTADPNLPTAKQIFTSDYTNGGYDRGHMTRSADRTAGNTDNAATFYLTNVVPQQADLNQGVWATFENALADSAKAGRAVYVITGPLYSKANPLVYIKNEGKIAIPDSTWKIAVIGPDPAGVPFTKGNVQSLSDLANITVLAVNMPNIAGVRNDPFSKYLTTVAKIETATGYNFLSGLSESLQCRIEVRNCVPEDKAVSATGSNTVAAGSQFVLNTSAVDADGADGPWKLSIDWGDGTSFASTLFALPTSARPFARGKVWSAPGNYTVTLTVTDKNGGKGVTTLVVTVTP